MATGRKKAAARSVRQSVTIPGTLVLEVRRVAKEKHVTLSRALVALAERAVRAELEAKEQLKATYHRFVEENDPAKQYHDHSCDSSSAAQVYFGTRSARSRTLSRVRVRMIEGS